MRLANSLDLDGTVRYRCDMCGESITGERWFCSVCDEDSPTFDVCAECVKLDHPHPLRRAKRKSTTEKYLTTRYRNTS